MVIPLQRGWVSNRKDGTIVPSSYPTLGLNVIVKHASCQERSDHNEVNKTEREILLLLNSVLQGAFKWKMLLVYVECFSIISV